MPVTPRRPPARAVNPTLSMWTTIAKLPSGHRHDGQHYEVLVEGREREDGTWEGRIVYRGGAGLKKTKRETSQPDKAALEYWATGLEQVYLDGAFERAQ
jgi:hypothetical protein